MKLKSLFTVPLILLLSACVVLPETAKEQDYAQTCEMSTRKLQLTIVKDDVGVCHSIHSKEELLACLTVGGVISSASLIISGSIVVVGNTIHWLEYQTTCSESDSESEQELSRQINTP
ncbi:hypothetical protein [Vibrio mangrovi]|uniref:Lipoprotein n=1 Tax=Vibrio mangrovi TaxID=474394 RepID=A0A1Y6J1G6_9VIBR|nr:hypothetical protein [Vibrio mangrovi]MDW6005397.1 hypothetical protein [Vibrio mangrovi]SMS02163.1 hypothetical protein VIM7927_03481 [Vibrio mangrovi]